MAGKFGRVGISAFLVGDDDNRFDGDAFDFGSEAFEVVSLFFLPEVVTRGIL